MHNILLKLFLFALFIISAPSHAESTCGSDTSSNPDVARGKDVWLNGYCKSFLLCRLALEQFHACQAAESFLANLGAEQGVALTEEQVGAAVVKTKQSIGVDATSEKKPMSSNFAMIEFNRVTDMDSKAAALVQSNCGAFACDRLLESTVNPVIREVEALNSNTEYLTHLPKFSPIASVEMAGRFGWKKDGAFWVQSGAINASGSTVNTSTLKEYLLSKPECQTLHDKLSQEIKTNPTKEPFNLSFFEGECVAQVASYAEDVKNWRTLLVAKTQETKPLSESANTLSTTTDNTLSATNNGSQEVRATVAPDAELKTWNDGLVAAEKQREAELLVAADAKQKAEQEQKRLAEETARRHAAATEEAEQRAIKNGWVLPSDCQAEQSAVRQYQANGGDAEGPITESLRRPWVYRWGGKNGEMSVDELKQSEQGYLNSITEYKKKAANCRAATGLDRIMCPTEDETFQTRLDRLTACAYGVAATRKGGNVSSSTTSTNQSTGDPTCEVKFKAIDSKVAAALPNCGASASCNLQAAMWGLSQQISTIESYCPSGKFTGNLYDWRKQLESVTTTCNQIISGGRCESKL